MILNFWCGQVRFIHIFFMGNVLFRLDLGYDVHVIVSEKPISH
jgi:hypothetical protein